jgi:hypothetical protein
MIRKAIMLTSLLSTLEENAILVCHRGLASTILKQMDVFMTTPGVVKAGANAISSIAANNGTNTLSVTVILLIKVAWGDSQVPRAALRGWCRSCHP